VFVYLESPCNPHGYVLDVPAICCIAHAKGMTVVCDATIATPFLQPTLRRADKTERPGVRDPWISIALAAFGGTVATIGPGAWSIDARLFGRKHIEA
jgi:O-acetylhomoserine/O-acetylserine sulfhydrylase-like pyridoxal-dependent enzyme